MFYYLIFYFYWPTMPLVCHSTAVNCDNCITNRLMLRKTLRLLKLFPVLSTLEFIAIDILGELFRTPRGNRIILVILYRFSDLVRVVPMKMITAMSVAMAFVKN